MIQIEIWKVVIDLKNKFLVVLNSNFEFNYKWHITLKILKIGKNFLYLENKRYKIFNNKLLTQKELKIKFLLDLTKKFQ